MALEIFVVTASPLSPTEGQEYQRTASTITKRTTKKKQKEAMTQKPSPRQGSRAKKVKQSKIQSESEDSSESENDSVSEDDRTLAEEFQYRLDRIEEQTYQLNRYQSFHKKHIYALKSAVQRGFGKLTAEIDSLRDAIQTFSSMEMNSHRQETNPVFEKHMEISRRATSVKAASAFGSSRVAGEGIRVSSSGIDLQRFKPFMERPTMSIQPLAPTSSTGSQMSYDQPLHRVEGRRTTQTTPEPRRSLGPSFVNQEAQNLTTPEKNELRNTTGPSFESPWISPDTTEHGKTSGLSQESTESQPQIPISGRMIGRKERTIPNEKELQSIRKNSCSQQNFAKRLAFDIFPLSELLTSNVLGKMRQGIAKPPLHVETMEWIKETCLTMFPVEGVDPERQWANCVNSINKAVSDYNRRMKRFNVQTKK